MSSLRSQKEQADMAHKWMHYQDAMTARARMHRADREAGWAG